MIQNPFEKITKKKKVALSASILVAVVLWYSLSGCKIPLTFAIRSGSIRLVDGALCFPCHSKVDLSIYMSRQQDSPSIVGATYALKKLLKESNGDDRKRILQRLAELRDSTNLQIVKRMATTAIEDAGHSEGETGQ